MRELLFRGQTRKFGEKVNLKGEELPGKWVFGGIFQPSTEEDFSIIDSYENCEKYRVYTDTVSQYTGMRDRYGVKIFEGDIVYVDKNHCDTFCVVWDCYSFLLKNRKRTRGLFDYETSIRRNKFCGTCGRRIRWEKIPEIEEVKK